MSIKKLLRRCCYLLLFCFIGNMQLSCMVGDESHSQQDYIRFANERPSFNASCYVYDKQKQIAQTGVLIAPNIVATAAHGVSSMIAGIESSASTSLVPVSNITITFENSGTYSSYQAESVLIDSRYLQNILGTEGKYDIALIKLKEDVAGVTPARLFPKAEVPQQSPLYVATFGSSDIISPSLFKRAFMLFERDTFYANPLDNEMLEPFRTALASSLFFKPDITLQKPGPQSEEIISRTYEATQNWLSHNKKPYGLALPGTSGAPVFITLTLNGKSEDYLFGIITSFAPVSQELQAPKGQKEHEYILQNKKKAFGSYQSIFALFYQEDTQSTVQDIDSKIYCLDKNFINLFKEINGAEGDFKL